jgi:hypothetical protein
MRISHRQLEQAEHDPRGWARAQEDPPRFTQGYDSYLRHAIARLHKSGTIIEAEQHLTRLFARAAGRLTNQTRIDDTFERLRSYNRWWRGAGLANVACNVRIELSFEPHHVLGGRVDRIDVAGAQYQGVLLGTVEPGWSAEFRYPLLQVALADLYQVPVQRTSVGVQNLDGTDLDLRCYTEAERLTARERLQTLGRALPRTG